MKDDLSESFGKNKVSTLQRQKLIRSVFQRVAKRYDLMNDIMSMGIHRLWKWRFTREIKMTSGHFIVDLAGGTGDIAQSLINQENTVCIVDPSLEMMKVAKHRLKESCLYVAADAQDLPFSDNSVDILTISFGIRNVTNINLALKEINRVLKPGGSLYCLEFSTPVFWLRPIYNAWSRIVIPRLGALVSKNPDAYHYLIESIAKFPSQQEMVEIIQQSGFNKVSFSNLSLGIACIHRAIK